MNLPWFHPILNIAPPEVSPMPVLLDADEAMRSPRKAALARLAVGEEMRWTAPRTSANSAAFALDFRVRTVSKDGALFVQRLA